MKLSHALRTVVSLALIASGLLVSALPASAAGGLTLSMTASPEPVGSGGTITYTLRIDNPLTFKKVCDSTYAWWKVECRYVPVGSDASFVLVNDFLPSNVTYQSATGD